jgi:hypothetical protein
VCHSCYHFYGKYTHILHRQSLLGFHVLLHHHWSRPIRSAARERERRGEIVSHLCRTVYPFITHLSSIIIRLQGRNLSWIKASSNLLVRSITISSGDMWATSSKDVGCQGTLSADRLGAWMQRRRNVIRHRIVRVSLVTSQHLQYTFKPPGCSASPILCFCFGNTKHYRERQRDEEVSVSEQCVEKEDHRVRALL